MNKNYILFLFAIFFCCSSMKIFAEQKSQPVTKDLPKITESLTKNNELETVDLLISCTQKSLEEQKQLRSLIAEYQILEKQYIDSPNDMELLYKVIKLAKRTLENIKSSHLTHNFDSTFIDELTVFAQVGSKKGTSKTVSN